MKTPPKSQTQSPSLLFSVGSSVEKEQQRVERKLQQLKELGIELPDDEMMALLQRNCFSVPVAASEYFERLAKQDSVASGGAAAQEDEAAKCRLDQVLEKLEKADEAFQVLGRTPMQASVTRQGVKLHAGEELLLQAENAGKKRLRPGLSASSTASGIVRVATVQHAQIGRLERKMELLLHALVKSGLVRLGGVCEAPPVSSYMFASFEVRAVQWVELRFASVVSTE